MLIRQQRGGKNVVGERRETRRFLNVLDFHLSPSRLALR